MTSPRPSRGPGPDERAADPDPAPAAPLVARSAQVSAAARRLRRKQGTVVLGAAGIGKSALLETLVGDARASGLRVGRITGTSALGAIPFGALLRLVDPAVVEATSTQDPDPLRTAALVRSQILRLRLDVVAADDAHLLDAGTIGLIQDLAQDGVVVLAAIRRDGPATGDVVELTRPGPTGTASAELVELGALTLAETTTLASLRLDARCDAGLAEALHRAGGGNPMLVTQLLLAGVAAGSIAVVDGVAREVADIAPAPGLVELIRARLHGLPLPAQSLLAAVAVAEHVSLDVGTGLADEETVALLDDAEWLAVDARGRALRIRHPIVRDALLEAVGELGRVRGVDHLLAATEALRRPLTASERLSAARWRMALDRPVGVGEALAGAALTSLTEPELAERLLRAAVDEGGGGGAQVRLAAQLKRIGRTAEAQAMLGRAAHEAQDPAIVADISVWSGIVTGIGFRRSREALEALEAQLGPAGGTPDQRAVLAALQWREGRVVESLALSAELAEADEPTFASVLAGLHEAMIRAARGQRRESLERVETLRPLVPLTVELIPEGPPTLQWLDGWVPLVTELDPDPARSTGRAAYERHLARGDDTQRAQFAESLGIVELLGGRPASAAQLFREAADSPGIWRDSWYPLLLGRLVEALVLAGRADEARLAAVEMRSVRSSPIHRGIMTLGEAALRADDDDARGAAELALSVAAHAARSGDVVTTVDAAYAGVRYGDLRAARILVDAAPLGGPGRLAQRAHAAALLADSPGALDAASSRLAAAGLSWYAVEARATGARLRAERQDTTGSVVAAEQVQRLLAELPELQGGPVRRWHGPGLTQREAEVARLAAAGLADRAIGERMGISVRTVHAHVANVYRKVGVHSRSELRDLLSD